MRARVAAASTRTANQMSCTINAEAAGNPFKLPKGNGHVNCTDNKAQFK
jgi:hypothetical protein